MRHAALLVLLLLGCGETPAPTPPGADTPSVPSAPAPAPRPTRVERTDAHPHFDSDDLVSCTDIFAIMDEPAGVSLEDESRFRDRGESSLPDEILATRRLDQDCMTATQRVPLATCVDEVVSETDTGGSYTYGMRRHYYSFGLVFETDAMMSDCLRRGGDWSIVDRASSAALEAEGRHLARERERLEARIGRRR